MRRPLAILLAPLLGLVLAAPAGAVDKTSPNMSLVDNIPYEQAVEDVQAFLGDMVRRGLALPS